MDFHTFSFENKEYFGYKDDLPEKRPQLQYFLTQILFIISWTALHFIVLFDTNLFFTIYIAYGPLLIFTKFPFLVYDRIMNLVRRQISTLSYILSVQVFYIKQSTYNFKFYTFSSTAQFVEQSIAFLVYRVVSL